MLSQGVIERAEGKVFLSRVFLVPKKDSDHGRLILDLHLLNSYILHHKFRMLTMAQIKLSLQPQDWFASLDLSDAFWHVPIHPRFRKFLAFQIGESVFWFTRLPFGLSIAPRVFTKLTKVVAKSLMESGVHCLMYLDDWLISAESASATRAAVEKTLRLAGGMGFNFNMSKSHLCPSQCITWLGLEWNSNSSSVQISALNLLKIRRRLFQALHSLTFTRRQWESLLGSLNFYAEVLPLGRLHFRRLVQTVNATIPMYPRDVPLPVPQTIPELLGDWLLVTKHPRSTPWVSPLPNIRVNSDASNIGWGYQSNWGHQASGHWSTEEHDLHINLKELLIPLFFLQETILPRGTAVCFDMDNTAAVHCVNRQGSSKSDDLLSLSEQIFHQSLLYNLSLSATHLPGESNDWADALSRFRGSSVEWTLHGDLFRDLCHRWGIPQIDLFASPQSIQLPLFLCRDRITPAGGPDAFTEDWNQWRHIYLFPPPCSSLMVKVCHRLQSFRGRILLIAPYWPAQPWFHKLFKWCPNPLPLGQRCLRNRPEGPLLTTLRIHAWHFSVPASEVPSQRQ